MSKSSKALLYNFLGFALIYLMVYFGIKVAVPNIVWYWIPISAAIAGTFIAPKFQAIKSNGVEKLFMKFIFLKGIREIN